MRFLSILSSLLLVGTTTTWAQSSSSSSWSSSPSMGASSSCSPSSSDTNVVEFAWYLQFFIDRFYASVPLNRTILTGLPNASSVDYSDNIRGIQQKNRLGVRAVQQVGTKVPGFETPKCNYTIPKAMDSKSYLKKAASLEADLCGAFIGLSGYTQKPEISFLLTRLAAEHAAHASWLGSHGMPVFFQPNSTSLIPAYSPDYVLKSGSKPGMLGQYLHSCGHRPSGPCGKALTIGSLTANLTSPQVSSSVAMASSSATPTSS